MHNNHMYSVENKCQKLCSFFNVVQYTQYTNNDSREPRVLGDCAIVPNKLLSPRKGNDRFPFPLVH